MSKIQLEKVPQPAWQIYRIGKKGREDTLVESFRKKGRAKWSLFWKESSDYFIATTSIYRLPEMDRGGYKAFVPISEVSVQEHYRGPGHENGCIEISSNPHRCCGHQHVQFLES